LDKVTHGDATRGWEWLPKGRIGGNNQPVPAPRPKENVDDLTSVLKKSLAKEGINAWRKSPPRNQLERIAILCSAYGG